MSFDFSLTSVCPHEVAFELAEFDVNTGYVYFQRQPANSSNVKLYIDGTNIPPYGLYSVASLPFGRPEPYRITAGQNDLLYLGLPGQVPQFIQLMIGSNIKAADMAADLQRKIPNLLITVVNKHVVFQSRTMINGQAFSFPDPRWTDRTSSSPLTARSLAAFNSLQIVPGRVVIGKRIMPGWSLVQSPISPIITDKALKFDSILSNSIPTIQVSYSTIAQNCRRCFGSRIEYDYDIVDGSYGTVQDTDLLVQEFSKFLFTRLGSHWKWTWLGSRLVDDIGGKANGTQNPAPALISMDINQAYKVYANVKHQQEQRFPFQQISDAEMPNGLDSLSVQALPNDPTTAIVNMTIRSRSRIYVPLKRVIGTPNAFNLTDGTGGPPFAQIG